MERVKNILRDEKNQSGQALVEGAAVVVVALLLLGGLVEFGWAYFRYLAMQDAAGEGAAYGIVYPDRHDSTDNPNPDNIVYRAQNESNSPLLDWSATTVTVESPFTTPGNLITVTIASDHQPIMPILAPLFGDGLTLRAKAVQKIIAPAAGA